MPVYLSMARDKKPHRILGSSVGADVFVEARPQPQIKKIALADDLFYWKLLD
jgi:hypothetical protein